MRKHEKHMIELAHQLSTDVEDCAAWVGEFVMEQTGENEPQFEHDELGDCLYPEQIDSISQSLIEHFGKENELTLIKTKGLVYFLKTH
jgi:hypothetical protein